MKTTPESGGRRHNGETFDRIKDRYDDLVNRSIAFSGLTVDFFTRAKARHLLAVARRQPGGAGAMDALDVGCGKGSIHPHLASSFRSLTGVDVAPALLEKAGRANPGVAYHCFDGARLPFDSSRFHLVFAICVLHHVPPESWLSFLAEMHRVARPGGLVMLFEHNPWNPLTRYAVGRCEFDEGAVLVPAAQARRLFAQVGLAEVRTRFIIFAPVEGRFAWILDNAFARLALGAQYFIYGRKL